MTGRFVIFQSTENRPLDEVVLGVVDMVDAVLEVQLLGRDHEVHDAQGQGAQEENGQEVRGNLQALGSLVPGQEVVAAADPVASPDEPINAERDERQEDEAQQTACVLAIIGAGGIRFLGLAVEEIERVDAQRDDAEDDVLQQSPVFIEFFHEDEF